jgi:hypothetical protein
VYGSFEYILSVETKRTPTTNNAILLRRLQAIRSIVFVGMVFLYFAFFSGYIRARVTYYIPKVAPGVALQPGENRFLKKFFGLKPGPDK